MTQIQHQATIPDDLSGKRLDQAAAQLFPDYSRARLQEWIKMGALTINQQVGVAKEKVIGGEQLFLSVELQADERVKPQNISLDIVHEDDSLLIINKPAGLVVHPGSGHSEGTLVNALVNHAPKLAELPRAGLVHRIDKDTTGLLVVAKTLEAHTDLVAQLQAKLVKREYEAIAQGVMTGGGKVDAPIGRHPTQRTKQAVVSSGREAVTHYRVVARYRAHTHIRLALETGRTHQIRVHMAHIHYPLLGDPDYGGRLRLPKAASPEFIEALQGFRRQALHAQRLALHHPESGDWVAWEVPLPEDFVQLLAAIKADHALDG
ncbi:Ribosomal large subunit pseudouridine synthase D [gamma proteobacterium HdN1]|nr:Ribosomal large subunit pseudouridine synthase D [gamma proteobacterium HdN1]